MKEYSFKLGIGYDDEFNGPEAISRIVQIAGDNLSEKVKTLPGVKWAGGDADEDPVIYELIVVGDISRNDIEAFLEYESNSSGSEGDLINYDFDEEKDYVNSGRPMDKLFSKGGKFWIQDAIKNKGALRKTAKAKGLLRNDKEKLSVTDLHKLEKMGGKTAKRAHLAETLKKMDGGGKIPSDTSTLSLYFKDVNEKNNNDQDQVIVRKLKDNSGINIYTNNWTESDNKNSVNAIHWGKDSANLMTKEQLIQHIENINSIVISITYDELLALKNKKNLIKGKIYLATDRQLLYKAISEYGLYGPIDFDTNRINLGDYNITMKDVITGYGEEDEDEEDERKVARVFTLKFKEDIKKIQSFSGGGSLPVESKKYPGQFTLGEDDGEKAMYTKEELQLLEEGYVIELELNASRRGKAEMEAYQKEYKFETRLTNTKDEFGGRWRVWRKAEKMSGGGKIPAGELEEIYLSAEKSGNDLDWVLKQHGYTMADFENSVDKNKMPFAPGGKVTTRIEKKYNGQRDGKDIYYDANAAWTQSYGVLTEQGGVRDGGIAKVFRKGSGEDEVKYYKKNKDYKILREEKDRNGNTWLIDFLDTTSPTKATISFQLGDLYAPGGTLVVEDENDTEYKLEYISNLIRQGNTSGYNPYWKLNIKFDGELESSDTEQIAEYVEQGYHEGQIVSGEEGKTGWWNIEVEDTFSGGGQVGKRIKMIKMSPDPHPIEPGTMGTIRLVDGIGQIHVNWDNGRTLAMIPEDEYEVVDDRDDYRNSDEYQRELRERNELKTGGPVEEEQTLWLIDGKPVKLKTGTPRSIKAFITKNKLHTKYSGKAGLQIWPSNASEEEVVKYTTTKSSATSQQYDLGGAIKFIEKAGNGYAVTTRLFGGWNLEQNRMPIGKYSDSQIIEFAERIGYVPTFADGGRLALLKKMYAKKPSDDLKSRIDALEKPTSSFAERMKLAKENKKIADEKAEAEYKKLPFGERMKISREKKKIADAKAEATYKKLPFGERMKIARKNKKIEEAIHPEKKEEYEAKKGVTPTTVMRSFRRINELKAIAESQIKANPHKVGYDYDESRITITPIPNFTDKKSFKEFLNHRDNINKLFWFDFKIDGKRTRIIVYFDGEKKGKIYFDGKEIKSNAEFKAMFPGKPGAKELKSYALLKQIDDDFRSFRPGGEDKEISVDSDTVTAGFRYLGDWEDDEESAFEHEDEDSDDYDPDWREDNDNQIWAEGEYKRFFNYFKDWAKNYSWKKYVDLDLDTSEKNWCYFTISLKKKK